MAAAKASRFTRPPSGRFPHRKRRKQGDSLFFMFWPDHTLQKRRGISYTDYKKGAFCMTTDRLAAACGFRPLFLGGAREVTGVFCGDLISWAMVRAKAGDAWCTVTGGENTVAAAVLAGCACVVLCHGAEPDAAMLRAAKAHGVSLFAAGLPEFEAGAAVARAMGEQGRA